MDSAQDFSRIGCAFFLECFEKVPKIGLESDFEGSCLFLAWGPFRVKKWVLKKMVLWRNDSVVEF